MGLLKFFRSVMVFGAIALARCIGDAVVVMMQRLFCLRQFDRKRDLPSQIVVSRMMFVGLQGGASYFFLVVLVEI